MRSLHNCPVRATFAGAEHVSQDGGGSCLREHSREGQKYEYHTSSPGRCGHARTRRFGPVAELVGGGRIRRRGGGGPGGRGAEKGDSGSGEDPIRGAVRRSAKL